MLERYRNPSKVIKNSIIDRFHIPDYEFLGLLLSIITFLVVLISVIKDTINNRKERDRLIQIIRYVNE